MKKVKFHTLGCKVNLYETEAMKGLFKNAGYTVTEDDDADVFVINTCTVTAVGDKKSRQFIRRAKKSNPKSIVAVVGCYSQVSPDEVAKIPDVDIILGTTDRKDIVKYVESFSGEKTSYVKSEIPTVFEDIKSTHQSRTRATIKVQDGCRNFCSYCIIPYARGPLRSKSIDSAVSEIKELSNNGYKEIVLVGINLSVYGADIGTDLLTLIENVCKTDGIERVRLGSLEPNLITDEFISRTKGLDNFCHHFHLALQSGSTSVLKRMNRKYTKQDYLNAVEKLKNAFSDCAITTDVMVGFPGETEEEFKDSCDTVKKSGFCAMHVFPYSKRKGTVASKMENQIDEGTKKLRSEKMIEIGEKLKIDYYKKYVGKTLPVLFEKRIKDGVYEGHTKNFIFVKANGKANEGEIKNVLLNGYSDNFMTGEIL